MLYVRVIMTSLMENDSTLLMCAVILVYINDNNAAWVMGIALSRYFHIAKIKVFVVPYLYELFQNTDLSLHITLFDLISLFS